MLSSPGKAEYHFQQAQLLAQRPALTLRASPGSASRSPPQRGFERTGQEPRSDVLPPGGRAPVGGERAVGQRRGTCAMSFPTRLLGRVPRRAQRPAWGLRLFRGRGSAGARATVRVSRRHTGGCARSPRQRTPAPSRASTRAPPGRAARQAGQSRGRRCLLKNVA